MSGSVIVPVEPTEAMMNACPSSFSPSFAAIWPKVCRDIYQAMLTAAPVREEGGALDDRLHNAISKLKDWVSLIQLRKNGGCVSGNPIVDCVNDLPVIIRELEAAELEIEGAFEALEDAALATREEAPAEAGERECGWCDGRKTKQTPSTDFTIPCPYCKGTGKEALRGQPQAREDAQPVAGEPIRGEVSDEWADKFCEAVNWSPEGHECKTVEGQLRCVTFRDLAKGYILSAIATQPSNTHPAPDALRVAVEALEFYADEEAWVAYGEDAIAVATDENVGTELGFDSGEKARQALAALQAEQKGGAA